MDDCGPVSQQYEVFKKNIETRSTELMEHLEQSRNTFWENLQACKEYVIEQAQSQSEQKVTNELTDQIGAEILADLEKIEACVAHISTCKQSLKSLSQGRET